MAASVTIRSMLPDDWPAVRSIYSEGMASGNSTFERTAPAWQQWDAAHLHAPRLMAMRAAEALGWAALSPVSKRTVYAGVAEVSIYIAASAQRQGIGRLLLGHLITASEEAGLWTLQGGIFPENVASLALFDALGFRRVGVRERIGQMDGRWRDTVIVERRSQRVGF